MAITPEVEQQIIEAIQRKAPRLAACPVCQTGPWLLSEGFINLIIQDFDSGGGIVLGGPTMPTVALVCSHCGHTLLFNLIALGLRDLVTDGEGVV